MSDLDFSKALSVSELNVYIKDRLEEDFFLSSLLLRGEISNFKSYPSGHCYFTLKDSQSTVSAVIWNTYAGKLDFHPKDGDEVLVHGRISVYPPRGSYQLSIDHMELFGLGAELIRLQKLKEKLQKEGLFDASRKRKLPRFPKKVAVIAGKDSAGLRDIEVNLLRRFPLVELAVFPALVQGKQAPEDLRRALVLAKDSGSDVLILARGGGSSEDLSAFNDEALVRALASYPSPIISAVGHEVDVTLCDLVADVRVSTPTAAAVLAVPDKNELYQDLDEALMRLGNAIEADLRRYKGQVEQLSSRSFFLRPETLYSSKREKLGETLRRLLLGVNRQILSKKENAKTLEAKLSAMNPYEVLRRGYSITEDESGKPITSVMSLREGQRLKTRMKDGIITSEVLSVTED